MEPIDQMEYRLAKIEDAQLRTEKNMDKLTDAVMKLAEAETDRALLHQKVESLESNHKEDHSKVQKQFNTIFLRIREEDKRISDFVTAGTLKGFTFLVIGYAITFGVWVNHEISTHSEKLTATIERERVQMKEINSKFEWYCGRGERNGFNKNKH